MVVRGHVRGALALTALALALCASLIGAASSWGWSYKVTTLAKGLDEPRGLAIGPDGNVYVAEAGHAGEECGKAGEEEACIGFTSGVSRIEWSGAHHRVLSGLLSLGPKGGGGAVGVDALSFYGDHAFPLESETSAKVPTGPGISPSTLATARAEAGRLGIFDFSGHGHVLADVGGFDYQWSMEHASLVPGQFPDANPYDVLATQWGELVVDAASNTLDFVDQWGHVKVLAFIPNPPVPDAVPTCLDRGPDGAIYIGELSGAGNGPGASVVWRWTPGEGLSKWATGLTAVTGCGWAGGQFYAVELSTKGLIEAAPFTGAVVRVPPHSSAPETVVSGLSFPGGFAFDGRAGYVSNWTVRPAIGGGGEVLRITAG